MKNALKKAISVLLIAVMVFGAAPLAGFLGLELPELNLFSTKAEATTSGTCGENATWTFDEATGELVITGTGEIYDEAFRNNNTIKSVKISEGITKIGTLAFAECNSLTSVVFPESLVEFGDVSFGLCFNLSEIVLPGNIKRMGGNPFQETAYAYDNRGEDGSLYIGTCLLEAANTSDFIVKEGTTVIAAGAFQNMQYSRLVISAGVEYIPERLFENARISELVVPYTINTISDFLFGSNWPANIDTIYFSGSYNEWERIYFEGDPNSTQYNVVQNFFKSDVEMIFDSQGYGQEGNYTYSINKFNEAVITEFSGTCNGELVIPETLGGYPVTGIGDNVFSNRTSITTVNIPERITYIGRLAFFGCTNLINFTLPDVPIHIGAQVIENTGYYNDTNNWHKDILYVGNHLITRKGTDLGFEIQEGAIKEGTITIAAEGLGGTYNMGDTLILPDSLVYIEEAAFMSSFISNVEIPDSVIYLGPHAFAMSGISSLKLSSRLTEIHENTFSQCLGLETLTVPLRVNYINMGAFYGCENLNSIVLPKSLQIISYAAFVDPCFPDDIYYESTEEDWEKVRGKERLEASMIHFNYEYENVYSVKWVVDGKKTVVDYIIGEEIIIPETPVKEGYTFAGWSAEIPSAMPDYDLIFTAQWEINKHTVTWIVDGKETVEEYRYGDEIVAPENPTKEGYTFAGWGEEIPSTVPDEDLVFTVQWEINKHTVTWIVDGKKTVVEYNYGDKIVVPQNPTKEGYTFYYWDESIPSKMPDRDLIFNAVWRIRKHTVTWIVDGEKTVVNYNYGDGIVVPENPAKEGYTFAGWGAEIPATVPDNNLTFTAQWTVNIHTVTWIVDGEKTVDEYSYGDEIVVPENPIKEGYTFAGWGTETPVTVPDEDLIFTAQWEINKHTVTWMVDGEKTVDEYSYGDEIAVPETPTKEGYTFVGWGAEIPATVPDEDLIFTAHWEIAKYTVRWVAGIKETVVEYKCGDKIDVLVPQADGLTFVKWIPEVPATMPAENLEFTAVFESKSYTVEWNIDGLIMRETYKFGDAIDKTKSFNKKGYTFVGWSPEIPDTMPAQNLEFTAIFEANLYDAVFYTNGGIFSDGDSIKRIPTAYNTAIIIPQNPEKAGYEFAGWAYNGKNIGTNLGIMNSVEGKAFEAIWASNNTTAYKIETYTMNTLGEYDVSSVLLNATVFEEITVNPVESEGFEINTGKSVLSGVVSAEETLVLKVYLDRKHYSFTTVVDNIETSVLYYYGSIITQPETPVKNGYTFVGWDSIIPATMPSNDITVTAKFNVAPQDTTTPRIVMVTPENRTIYYGESITLQVRTYNMPEGARIKWEVSGDGVSIKSSSSGKSCKVTSTSNGNVVIRAYIVDSNGNTIAGKDGKPIYDFEYLYSEVNFWLMIINFIKQLFGKTDVVSQMFRVIY